ncbi:aryl-alcohol dehydrogenase AAD14 [Exophiala aquamarina CBS 119918]|uniref:Aldo-keto reductase ausK n=1 Tax=Exophiala aquamarina CBS 119918 TaxID=1182545 RepID=A0A072P8M2_9EURO|nr:aryl-alcohol dehydrogenase AAD14 [Exophiala aquamarina CBS 119918]KEF51915.1 aryl-alcohol dehydrogenase AAD14 [Exophiala aquamarina CBS 119918]
MAASFFAPAPEPTTELGRYRILSSTAGVRVSPLCLGAMSIGDAWSEFMGSMNKESSFQLLDAFYEAGGNFIDTANNYQDEQSEKWIGDWMEARQNRDMIVLATKYTTPYRSYELGKGKTVNYSGNHKRSLHLSVRDSLKKLKTDYIDLLYVHWWKLARQPLALSLPANRYQDHTTSIEEMMDSLHILVQQGKILYLGISDTPAWIVSAANVYAREQGKTQFSVYQGRWNIMARDFERDIIPMARHFGMALAPWDVVGGGKFQSKKQIEERKKQGEGLRSFMGSEQSEQQAKVSAALEKVANEHGIESLTAVALAYVMQKTPHVFPIIGGRKVEHLKDNIQSLSLKLTDEQIQYLESQTDFDLGFPGNFTGHDPKWTGQSSMMLSMAAHVAFPSPNKAFVGEKK